MNNATWREMSRCAKRKKLCKKLGKNYHIHIPTGSWSSTSAWVSNRRTPYSEAKLYRTATSILLSDRFSHFSDCIPISQCTYMHSAYTYMRQKLQCSQTTTKPKLNERQNSPLSFLIGLGSEAPRVNTKMSHETGLVRSQIHRTH